VLYKILSYNEKAVADISDIGPPVAKLETPTISYNRSKALSCRGFGLKSFWSGSISPKQGVKNYMQKTILKK
jgi:hypothetical protein